MKSGVSTEMTRLYARARHGQRVAGLAGMFVSALSSGSGAYLAAKSEREIYEAEFARERGAVENNEIEARELLSLTHQVRGLSIEGADHFVGHLAEKKDKVIEALSRERLHISEEVSTSPGSPPPPAQSLPPSGPSSRC